MKEHVGPRARGGRSIPGIAIGGLALAAVGFGIFALGGPSSEPPPTPADTEAAARPRVRSAPLLEARIETSSKGGASEGAAKVAAKRAGARGAEETPSYGAEIVQVEIAGGLDPEDVKRALTPAADAIQRCYVDDPVREFQLGRSSALKVTIGVAGDGSARVADLHVMEVDPSLAQSPRARAALGRPVPMTLSSCLRSTLEAVHFTKPPPKEASVSFRIGYGPR
jgi:hypothetical protein